MNKCTKSHIGLA